MSSAPKVPKNPPPLTAGMDNPWYDYAPFPPRPKLAWPRTARVAFSVRAVPRILRAAAA